MEEWRNIKDFENYQVSNLGRVRNKRGTIIKSFDNGHGYLRISLCRDGKHYNKYIHRLVADAFIDNPHGLSDVNHINEQKHDNRVENLEFVSHKDNCNYGTRTERQSQKISGGKNVGAKKIICVTTGEIFDTVKQGADKYNIHAQNISQSIKLDIHCGKLEDGTKLKWDYYEEEVA